MAVEMLAEDDCCPPGDITVTPVPSGYMIGRVMPKIGLGPWWQYIRVVTDYDEAVGLAVRVAAEDGTQAWFYRDRKYIALGGSSQHGPSQGSDHNSRQH